MKKAILLVVIISTSFTAGFAVNELLTPQNNATPELKRVTGIGGIFFKCKDPKQMREWYKTHLGIQTNQYGAVFEWRQGADSSQKGFTQWSPFKETTKYFAPSTKDFMINYRVDNLEALVEQLKKENVTITDSIESFEYGKFVHILDMEQNKIELWQPNDIAFEQMGIQMGCTTTK